MDSSWTLFLDRDGVINRRLPGAYVRHWDEFAFTAGAPEAIRILSQHFGRLIVVTNQQGIGKGLMSEQELQAIHHRMLEELEAVGGRVDAIFFCPNLKSDQASCRKPNPGMALQAKARFPEIDFHRSVVVGDGPGDMAFGAALGMRCIWIETSPDYPGEPERCPDFVEAEYRFGSLLDFAKWIERQPEETKESIIPGE